MTQLQDLKSLNKSSARVATFAAKLCDGIVEKYTYFQKISQLQVTAHKFEVTLVGSNPQEYCKGFVKASKEDCEKAAAKFKDGTVWALSKVAFDTYTAGQYISTPILYRVDLSKSIMTCRDTNSDADKALRASMPPAPVPPTSVVDLTRITTNRSTDLIAVVKEVGNQTRRSKADELIVDVLLVDGTMASSGNLATIDVSVFGASKIDKLKKQPWEHRWRSSTCRFHARREERSPNSHTTVKTKSPLRQNAIRRPSCARKLVTSHRRPTQKHLLKYGFQKKRGTLADHRHCLALRSWITRQRLPKQMFQM